MLLALGVPHPKQEVPKQEVPSGKLRQQLLILEFGSELTRPTTAYSHAVPALQYCWAFAWSAPQQATLARCAKAAFVRKEQNRTFHQCSGVHNRCSDGIHAGGLCCK